MLNILFRLAIFSALAWLLIRYLSSRLRGSDTPQIAHTLPPEPPAPQVRTPQPLAPATPPVQVHAPEPSAPPVAEEPPPIPEALPPAPATLGAAEEPAPSASEPVPAVVEESPPETPVLDAVAAAVPDDLTQIEGLGPKSAAVLQAAGITTFAHLAAHDVVSLQEIVHAAGLRLVHPETWPEQAALLAAGDLEGFKRLTADLKGGRRTPATPSDGS